MGTQAKEKEKEEKEKEEKEKEKEGKVKEEEEDDIERTSVLSRKRCTAGVSFQALRPQFL